MQYKKRSRQVTISDPRAAAVFTRSPLRRVLLQFSQQPRSVSEVASELAIDLKKLHHTVTKLCQLGLIEVVEVRKRAGRAIKLYQCTAERYYIPSTVAPEAFSRGLSLELQAAIVRDSAATIEAMEFWLSGEGRVSGRVVERRGARSAPLDSWRILRLSASQAKLLKTELLKVLDRFEANIGVSGEVYLVHTGMARRLDQSGATDNAKPRTTG